MNTAHDKTKYLYEDIRNCIREGMSIKDTAIACDVSEVTVANYTKDIREVRTRSKRVSDEVVEGIVRQLVNGEKPKDIAEQRGLNVDAVYRIKHRRKADIDKQRNAAETFRPMIVDERSSVQQCTPHEHFEPKSENTHAAEAFRNMSANFDGRCARYSVRDNRTLRMMIGSNWCEIELSEIAFVATELNLIAKMFA